MTTSGSSFPGPKEVAFYLLAGVTFRWLTTLRTGFLTSLNPLLTTFLCILNEL